MAISCGVVGGAAASVALATESVEVKRAEDRILALAAVFLDSSEGSAIKGQLDAAIEAAEEKGIVFYADSALFRRSQRARVELVKKNALEASKPALKKDLVGLKRAEEAFKRADESLMPLRHAAVKESGCIYALAKRPEMPFILGGEVLRGSAPEAVALMKNTGVLAGEKGTSACAAVKSTLGLRAHAGAILCDNHWSVFKNDAAMLGVIHAGRTVYVARTPAEDGKVAPIKEELWDGEAGRPRVLGREIAMLCAAGYEQVATEDQIEKYGYVFVPKDREALARVTLHMLQTSVERMTEPQIMACLAYTPETAPLAAACGGGAGSSSEGAFAALGRVTPVQATPRAAAGGAGGRDERAETTYEEGVLDIGAALGSAHSCEGTSPFSAK